MNNFLKPVTSSLPDIRSLGSHLNWIVLLLINFVIIISFRNDIITPEVRVWAPHLSISLVLIALVFYSRLQIKAVDRPSFLPLLIRLCSLTGLGILAILFLESLVYLFSSHIRLFSNPLVATAIYTLEILAGGVVLSTLLVGFKRLMLFEKTRLLVVSWRLFEYGLVTTTILSLFNIQFNTFFYNLIFIALTGLGVLLSVNLKWVGYLDFRQKLQALGLMLVQLLCLLFFTWFLYFYSSDTQLLYYAEDNMLLLVLLSFSLFCTGLSVLVIFFNLPTSSVFEKKLEDLNGIKQLQQSLRKKQSEEDLYQLLLENALKATDAQYGWIWVKHHQGGEKIVQSVELPRLSVNALLSNFTNTRVKDGLMAGRIPGRRRAFHLSPVQHPLYKSALVIPLRAQDSLSGYLTLLKNVPSGFNKDAIGIARLYAEQTCLSIENLQLLDEAIRLERYQEELSIARRVKESLLPREICCNTDCGLFVCSESADDVGGDYYDAYRLDSSRVALVVADVSGHGTSAAFTMSQLKGVFHSLVPQGLGCRDFLVQANSALSRGLGRTTFVTLVYGVLDCTSKTFTFVRAGHCPVLHYNREKNRVEAYHGKGMGLGLLRNSAYQEHIEEQTICYGEGDALLLYTDGIIECRNGAGEEYGQERLTASFEKYAGQKGSSAEVVCTLLMEELHAYAGTKELQDDFTTLVLKFS
ncbi:GAF domain-containing SpoIIE family protein phosphatase [Cesiribacter sp. SM1]|uniref:GAF domain-containing SpoIIE family protein phosphatase n=1 Tax=Cesiribacter sp. SM1 TaxID=2861196 RepID=UPI001CD217F0|nr:GAF domain-containing SpoIIE family protein phosphatase [Cesiribacter sp. SM1]